VWFPAHKDTVVGEAREHTHTTEKDYSVLLLYVSLQHTAAQVLVMKDCEFEEKQCRDSRLQMIIIGGQ
jgi:hypothetical protein